jgi:single-strand DNA-binding protein
VPPGSSDSAFHRLAENAATTLRKGDPVLVAGTETVTEYTDRDGNPRTGREIIADHLGVSLAFATAAIHRNTKTVDTTADPSWV